MPKIKRVVYSSDSSDEEIEVKKSKKERKTTSKPKKSDAKPEKTKKEKKSYTTKIDDSGPTQVSHPYKYFFAVCCIFIIQVKELSP